MQGEAGPGNLRRDAVIPPFPGSNESEFYRLLGGGGGLGVPVVS